MMNKLINIAKSGYVTSLKLATIRSSKNQKKFFLLSFPTTSKYILAACYEEFGNELVICYTQNATDLAHQFEGKCELYKIDNFFQLLTKTSRLLKGASWILCDNYFPFLAGIDFAEETKVVQLWHANGAIKNFGLEANYARKASDKDKERYQQVYNRFTDYIVASKRMADVFKRSYHVKHHNFHYFGYSPADVYFDKSWQGVAQQKFQTRFGSKKTLLYVPTYRESVTNNPLDFELLQKELGSEWQIIAKAHPHDQILQEKISANPSVATDLKGLTLQELLPNVDCLVSDYSSIPYEYSLANVNGRLVLFCYDLKTYQKEVGLQPEFENENSKYLVFSTAELIGKIKETPRGNLVSINSIWNTFNQGAAAKQLIDWMNTNEKN